jgi:RND family efflux transporter MFP subunit
MKNRIFLFAPLLGLALASVSSCQKAKSETETAEAKQEAPSTASLDYVTLAPVQHAELTRPIEAAGQLSSESEAQLSFKTGGLVRRVLVKEGDFVQKGQLLATLDLTEINAQVGQAQQGQEKAKRDLDRFNRLLADSAAPLEAVQNLRTAYGVAREQARIARFNRQFSEIHSPVAGRVVRKTINEGELASPGTPVLFVAATAAAWTLKTGVADKDWARVQVGDPATVRLDAYPGRTFRGRVSRRAAGADPASGTWQIDVQVQPQPGAPLATGLFAQATLKPQQKASYQVIPAGAVVEGNGDDAFVFAPAAAGRVRKLPVRVAFMDGERVYVRSGLEATPQVVAEGSGFLTEYSTIKVR